MTPKEEQVLRTAFLNNLTLDQSAALKILKQDIIMSAFTNQLQDPIQFAIERAQAQGQVSVIDYILSLE